MSSIGTGGISPLRDPVNGVRAQTPPQLFINRNRRPAANGTDWQNYDLGTYWLYWPTGSPSTQEVWQLVSLQLVNGQMFGKWVMVSGTFGAVTALTADDGNTAYPLNGLINIHNSDGYLATTAATANEVTINTTGLLGKTLTGNSGGAVTFLNGNINILGDTTTIDIVGDNPTHTLTVSTGGSVATEYVTDSGTAVPALGSLNVLGTSVLNTSGSGSTVDINLTNGANGQVIIGGGAAPSWGNITSGDGSITVTNGANTIAVAVTSPLPAGLTYETSTFTPELTFGGASTGITYASRGGVYTKIGNRVFFTLSMQLTSKGSSTGAARVTGLPYPATAATVNNDVAMYIGTTGALVLTAGYTWCWGTVFTSTPPNQIELREGNPTTGISDDITDVNFTLGTEGFTLAGSYVN